MPGPRARARRIIADSASNVAGLIRLFEVDDLPGETARQRMQWVLWLTASDLPGMQMGVFPPDDSGFRPELADGWLYWDPAYWADFVPVRKRWTKQVGHFLTAVGLRLNRWPNYISLNLVVGHEKVGDGLFLGFVRQFLAASAADRRNFLRAVECDCAGDAAGREAALQAIFGTRAEALHDGGRVGNSLVDLRLSCKGWRLGDELKRGSVATRQQVADWLRREVFDASRVRSSQPPQRPTWPAPAPAPQDQT